MYNPIDQIKSETTTALEQINKARHALNDPYYLAVGAGNSESDVEQKERAMELARAISEAQAAIRSSPQSRANNIPNQSTRGGLITLPTKRQETNHEQQIHHL